jgi:hypothetical protein
VSTPYDLRAERVDGTHFDVSLGGHSLADAKVHFEREFPHLAPFHWRGAVAFCEGRRPAEPFPSRRRRVSHML